MEKYRCQICGYIYDESLEKTKFEDLPDDWTCPLCGAPKSMFEEITEEEQTSKETEEKTQEKEEEKEVEKSQENVSFQEDDLRSLSDYEIAYICSNLAKSCEKQYLTQEQQLFLELANHYESKGKTKEGTLTTVNEAITEDLTSFDEAFNQAELSNDRGAKRVLTWASKATNIMKLVLDNYSKKGLDYLKNTKIWVCDICGFIYIGDEPPKVCPVCKVPSFKILEVE